LEYDELAEEAVDITAALATCADDADEEEATRSEIDAVVVAAFVIAEWKKSRRLLLLLS
jgi:hypothetical protein